MTDRSPARPVRLDDLIAAIKKTHDDALDQLSDAVLAAGHLGDVADHLVGHFVDQARRSGASWTEIGQSMGVTKQAAQKRFVPKEQADLSANSDFSRFTARARNVVVAAHERGRSPPATRRCAPSTSCSGSSPSRTASPSTRSRRRASPPNDCVRRSHAAGRRRRATLLVPYARAAAEGAGAHLPRGAPAGPQLRRHRARPAGPARARGRHGPAQRPVRRQGRGRGQRAGADPLLRDAFG